VAAVAEVAEIAEFAEGAEVGVVDRDSSAPAFPATR
jgi:hypothetical protein